MSKESIQGPLSALRNAGTVCGVCLTRGSEILVNLFPFSESRVNSVVSAIDEIQGYFQQQQRKVDQMSLGYDGGCLCVVEDDEFRLIVMHMLADEVDFIAKAARAFLADFQLDLFAEQIAGGDTRLTGVVTGNDILPAALMKEPAHQSPAPISLSAAINSATAPPSTPEAGTENSAEPEEVTEKVELIDLESGQAVSPASKDEDTGDVDNSEDESVPLPPPLFAEGLPKEIPGIPGQP
ncbi:MAG: hypothetical protein ACC661_10095, partial [Verrucomicrobiales bacterium]